MMERETAIRVCKRLEEKQDEQVEKRDRSGDQQK